MTDLQRSELLKNEGINVWFSDEYMNERDFDNCTICHISEMNPYISVSIKKPVRKEFNEAFIMEVIAKKRNAKKAIRTDWHKIFGKLTIVRVYETSYGLGMCALFQSNAEFTAEVQRMADKLTELGIDFNNEFSEAHWVYRFKISKSAGNVNKILNLPFSNG